MAFVYERIIQDDKPDWEADKMGLSFGKKLRKYVLDPSLCV